jgi:protein gp37
VGDKSAIEWTDATWNPVTGCSKVSPGCAHCYAETLALTRLRGREGYPGLPWTPANAAENVVLRPARLDQPLRWKRPRRIFVNSLSDLFHDQVPNGFIDDVFGVMAACRYRAVGDDAFAWHTFQILTKRPDRMRDYLSTDRRLAWAAAAVHYGGGKDPDGISDQTAFGPVALPNVWLGTSIENDRFTGRADALRETPAAVRFLSLEPLLGPLPSLDLAGIGWVIAGGESGPGFRAPAAAWVRDIRDRCVEAGVPFLFKQWGGRTSKAGGRELDGREWLQYPEAAS